MKPEIIHLTRSQGIQQPPVLSRSELHGVVNGYLERRQDYVDIATKNQVPLYLLESQILRARAHRFKQAFEDSVAGPVSVYYAVKSNNHPEVARILLEEHFGLDVSSGQELEVALGLGAEHIIFSGPGKTDKELSLAVQYASRVIILMDSFGELERLRNITTSLNKDVRCGVRLMVNAKGLWRKFGIPTTDLGAFWKAAERCPHIQLTGLQFHASWNLTATAQINYIRDLSEALDQLSESQISRLTFIDIGGGYWPEQGEWLQPAGTVAGKILDALGQGDEEDDRHFHMPAISIEEFARQLGEAADTYIFPRIHCRICLEPGRWICNDAVQLLISVVDKKAPDLVITDAGTNAVGWERFETDYFPILNLTRPSLSERRCHILGSLCTPHDVWGYAYFGEDIQPGDILMIPAQGAYTYSLRQRFIKPLPKLIMI